MRAWRGVAGSICTLPLPYLNLKLLAGLWTPYEISAFTPLQDLRYLGTLLPGRYPYARLVWMLKVYLGRYLKVLRRYVRMSVNVVCDD